MSNRFSDVKPSYNMYDLLGKENLNSGEYLN